MQQPVYALPCLLRHHAVPPSLPWHLYPSWVWINYTFTRTSTSSHTASLPTKFPLAPGISTCCYLYQVYLSFLNATTETELNSCDFITYRSRIRKSDLLAWNPSLNPKQCALAKGLRYCVKLIDRKLRTIIRPLQFLSNLGRFYKINPLRLMNIHQPRQAQEPLQVVPLLQFRAAHQCLLAPVHHHHRRFRKGYHVIVVHGLSNKTVSTVQTWPKMLVFLYRNCTIWIQLWRGIVWVCGLAMHIASDCQVGLPSLQVVRTSRLCLLLLALIILIHDRGITPSSTFWKFVHIPSSPGDRAEPLGSLLEHGNHNGVNGRLLPSFVKYRAEILKYHVDGFACWTGLYKMRQIGHRPDVLL